MTFVMFEKFIHQQILHANHIFRTVHQLKPTLQNVNSIIKRWHKYIRKIETDNFPNTQHYSTLNLCRPFLRKAAEVFFTKNLTFTHLILYSLHVGK